jgi:hypothetical protein
MAKCVNCDLYADYNVEHVGAESQQYCEAHLPWHINKKKLPDHVKNITAQPIIPPVVETPVVEVPTEEPTPVAKPKAKKAKAEDENTTSSDETGTSSSEDSAQS